MLKGDATTDDTDVVAAVATLPSPVLVSNTGSLCCASLHSWFVALMFYSADVCLYVCV